MKAFNPFGQVHQAPIAEQPQEQNDNNQRSNAAPVQQNTEQPVRRASSFNFDAQANTRNNFANRSVNNPVNKPVNSPQPQTYNAQKSQATHNSGFRLDSITEPRESINKISTVQKGGFRLERAAEQPDLYPHDVRAAANNAHNEVPSFEEEKQQLSAYEEKKILFNATREKVRGIKVSEIAKTIGASNREDKIKNKWKMPWGHNVSIRGQQWFNHNSDFSNKGGRDAVSFAKYIMASENGLNLDDSKEAWKAEMQAVQWLADTFGAEIDKSDLLMAKEDFQEKEKKRYTPPKNLEKYLPNVIEYLHVERKLPMWVINKQIEAGKLYAGVPKNFESFYIYDISGKKISKERDLDNLQTNEVYCIFKSGDDKMGAAECRCVKDENQLGFTKGFSEGSEKKYSGFFVVGEPGFEQKEVALTEAAIDSMSYQVLHPWAHVMSTGGTDNSELMLRIVCETLEHPLYSMTLAFDNDSAGEQTYKFILEKVQERYPEDFQSWIDSGKLSRKVPPSEKDWNKFLTTRTEEEILSYYHKNIYDTPVPKAAPVEAHIEADRFTKNVITTPTPILELTKIQESIETPSIAPKRASFTFASLTPRVNSLNPVKKTKP